MFQAARRKTKEAGVNAISGEYAVPGRAESFGFTT